MAEDGQGVLWVGSQGGVSRYNNGVFDTVAQLPCRGLYSDSQARLWVATPKNVWGGSEAGLELRAGIEELSSPKPTSFAEDANGNMWVGNLLTLIRYDPKAISYAAGWDPQLSLRHLGRDGRVWLTSGDTLYYFDGQGLVPWIGVGKNRKITAVLEGPEGAVWIAVSEPGVQIADLLVWKDEQLVSAGLWPDPFPWEITDLATAGEDTLWLGTRGGGLVRLSGGRVERWTTSDGLTHDRVVALTPGPYGVVWVGTAYGLSRFHGEQFTQYSFQHGLCRPAKGVIQISDMHRGHDGRLWVASSTGLSLFDGSRFNCVSAKISRKRIECLAGDDRGVLWASTGDEVKLFDGETFQVINRSDGLPNSSIRS